MTRFLKHAFSSSRAMAPSNRRPEPLSDQRYADLLQQASAFFATSVDASPSERQAAMADIHALMARYGLTVDDLT